MGIFSSQGSRHARRSCSVRNRPYLETLESRRLLTCDPWLYNAHADIEVEYKDEQLSLVIHDEDTDQTCNPEETYFYVGPQARTQVPEGWDFLGASGSDYWRVSQIRLDPDTLLLGGAAEELNAADFDTYRPADPRVTSRDAWIKVTLREFYGEGHASVWRDGQAPNQWWISSFDGGRTYEPTIYIAAGAHVDFNFGFSAPGYYALGLEASAFQNGSGLPIRSFVTFFTFYVEGGQSPGGAPLPGDAGTLIALTAASRVMPPLALGSLEVQPDAPAYDTPLQREFPRMPTEAFAAPGHAAPATAGKVDAPGVLDALESWLWI